MGYIRCRLKSHILIFRLESPHSTIASPEDGAFLAPRVVAGSPDRAHCRLSLSIPGNGEVMFDFVVAVAAGAVVNGGPGPFSTTPQPSGYATSSSATLGISVAARLSTDQIKPTSSRAMAVVATFGCFPFPMTSFQYF